MIRTLKLGLLFVGGIMMMNSCTHKETVQPATPNTTTGGNNSNPGNSNPNPNPNNPNPSNPVDTGIFFPSSFLIVLKVVAMMRPAGPMVISSQTITQL